MNWRIVFLLLINAFVCVACDQTQRIAEKIGVTASPLPNPEQIDLVCDARASTCTSDSLSATLDVVLPYLAQRPGSVLKLWSVGDDPNGADSRLLAVRPVGRPSKPTAQARRSFEERFVSEATTHLASAAAPLFHDRPRSYTPLFETLTAISLNSTRLQRQVILISDLRAHTPLAMLECGELPPPEALVGHLQSSGILPSGLLAETRVHLAFVRFAPVERERCSANVAHLARLQELWRAALMAAGARVSISSDVPRLEE